ncbi:hypothetical protein CBL_11003 [Carabus blaptoides fortunei]
MNILEHVYVKSIFRGPVRNTNLIRLWLTNHQYQEKDSFREIENGIRGLKLGDIVAWCSGSFSDFPGPWFTFINLGPQCYQPPRVWAQHCAQPVICSNEEIDC